MSESVSQEDMVLMGDDSDDTNVTSRDASHEIHKCWCYVR